MVSAGRRAVQYGAWNRRPSPSREPRPPVSQDPDKAVVDPDLLEIVACPETHQPLRMATAAELEGVNARIAAGSCTNVGEAQVEGALDHALVREDGQVLYPIRDEIPVLLVEEGIRLDG